MSVPSPAPVIAVHGTLAHAPCPGEVEIIEGGLVTVDARGVIVQVLRPEDAAHAGALAEARRSGALVALADSRMLLPGFVDLHVHAPQWPQLGKALDRPLEAWLREHTFPLEARYADPAFARASYGDLVATLLAHGTTTAVYYGSIHVPATVLLAEICLAAGQRAFVGKVAMDDRDLCPDYYRDASAAAALEGSAETIERVRALPGNRGLVQPIVTPRFIPACSDAALEGLGALAAAAGCAVQTHCSESDWEHARVLARHGASDARSLDRFHLLTDRTVLAHCVLASDGDLALMRARGAGIAHCPLSNVYYSNAVFPARRALDMGLRVGLGTDIAGGPSPSLLRSCAAAVTASRALEEGVDPSLPPERRGRAGARIGFREAFWMATAGGAAALGLPVGVLAPGQAFDAIVMDADAPGSDVRWTDRDTAEERLQKLIYLGGRANVVAAWTQGAPVASVGPA